MNGSDVIGRVGRVTGRVGSGLLGEVTVAWRGGTMACLALPVDRRAPILEVGERVLVADFAPPRTVYVSALGILGGAAGL